jgi:hypothetical protein
MSTLVFFVDDRFERGENMADWEAALRRADEVRQALLRDGWDEEAEPNYARSAPSGERWSSRTGKPCSLPAPACRPTR